MRAHRAQQTALLLRCGTHLGAMEVQSTACALPSASVRTRAASSWAAAGCRIRRSRAVRRIHRLRACAARGCALLNKGWSLVCCFPPRRRRGRRHRLKGSVCKGRGGAGSTGAPQAVPTEGCGLPGRGAGRPSVAGQRGAPARRNPPLQRPRHSASNARRILERWPACGRAGGDSPRPGSGRLPSRAALLPLVRLWTSVLAELVGAGWHAQASGEARAVGPVGGPAQAHWRQIPAGLRLSTG